VAFGIGAVEQIGVELVAKTGQFFSQVDGAVNKAEGKFAGMGAKISRGVALGLAGAGIAIAGIGVAAIKAGLDFEQQMTNIAAQTNIPQESLGTLRESILALSKELGVGSAELAAGAYFVLSAGFEEAADAANVLRAAAELSTIGLGSTEVTARALTQTLKAYGAGSEEADKYAAIFVGTVKAGAAEADELAGSLSNVVPFAAQLGVKFEVVAGALAEMTNKGFSVAEASTALNQLFTQLISPSDDLTESLARMGFTTDDLLKGLQTDALGTLTAIAEGAEKSGETVTLFADHVRAARAFVGAFGSGAAETAELVNKLGDAEAMAAGKADSLATVQESAHFKIKRAMNLLNLELVKLGVVLLPTVAASVDFFFDAAQRLERFVKANMTPVLIGLGAAFAALIVIAAPFLAGVAIALAPFLAFALAIAAVGAAFYLLEKKTKFFSATLLPAIKAFGAAALPVLEDFARAAIEMGQSLAQFLSPALDTLRDLWANLAPPILAVANALGQVLLPIFETVGGFLLEHKKLLIAVAAAMLLIANPWLALALAIAVVLAKWDEISAFFIDLGGKIKGLVDAFRDIPIIGAIFETAFSNIATVVTTALDLVINRLEFFIDTIRNTIALFGALLKGDWGAAWDALRAQMNAILDLIKGDLDIGSTIGAALVDLVSGIPAKILELLKKYVTPGNIGKAAAILVALLLPPILVVALIVRFREQIGSVIGKVPGMIKDGVSKVAGAIADNWFTIVNVMFPPTLLIRFRSQIFDLLKEVPGAIGDGLKSVAELVQKNWFTILAILFPPSLLIRFRSEILNFLGLLGSELANFVTSTLPGWIGDLATAFLALKPWEWVKEAISDFVNGFIDALLSLFGLSFISDWVAGLKSWLTMNLNPWEWVKIAVGTFSDNVIARFQAVVDFLSGIKQSLVGYVSDAFNAVKGAVLTPLQSLEREAGIIWDRIALFLTTLGDRLSSGFKAQINLLLIDPLNLVIGFLNRIPDIRTPFGSLGIPDISEVRRLAGGGNVAAGELVQVNERRMEFFRPFQSGTVLPIAPAGGADSSRRWTNYGKVINIYGPGRQSRDVLRELDR